MTKIEVIFTPAEFATLPARDLSQTVTVVFDILRATSSMIAALANGADSLRPVADIPEALQAKKLIPKPLLAGERDGFKIGASLTGGVAFDLGNSPREYSRETVQGHRIITTTTNGTRALRACAQAHTIVVSSFLNLRATVEMLRQSKPNHLIIVSSGTYEETAYEDVLAAGALCDALADDFKSFNASDSALIARRAWQSEQADLPAGLARSKNGNRLLGLPELRDDVAYCAQRDLFNFVALMHGDGWVRMSK